MFVKAPLRSLCFTPISRPDTTRILSFNLLQIHSLLPYSVKSTPKVKQQSPGILVIFIAGDMGSRNSAKLLELLSKRLTANGIDSVFEVNGELLTLQDPHLVDFREYGLARPPRQLKPDDFVNLKQTETQAILGILEQLNRREAARLSGSSESSKMATQKDDEIPWVKFPPKPEGWKGDPGNPNFKALGTLSPPIMRKIEPAGPHFLAYARRKRHGRTFSEDERIQAQNKVKKVEEDESCDISEPEDTLMLARDAKDWKGQDHYAVLGLSKYRWKATPEQIKNAHRKKVLRHHPDKKAAKGQSDDDSFFKCIQRANEILMDPVKRRQFDSVDDVADVEPPSKKETQKRGFFKMWNPVFESEARFSNVQPVPMLGNEKSTQEEVDEFYNFWYNFDSWRSFEYLDEDVPDDNEGRDHKRHIEKKNANARRKKKTQDIARLRLLVDRALELDERMKRFRKEKRAEKDKVKNEREAAAKREVEERQKVKEEDERKQKEAEEADKAWKAESKKAKDLAKNAVKKNKRVLKSSVKDVGYFATNGDASAAQIDGVLTDVELIVGKIGADELAALASKLSLAGKDSGLVQGAFEDEAKRLVGAGQIKGEDLKIFKA